MPAIFLHAVRAAALLLVVAFGSGPAATHEGHDHEEAPTTPAHVAPRGEAMSDAFQLVAVADGEALRIYLDRLVGNQPVTDATVEAETPEGPATAAAQPDGSYRLAAPWLTRSDHVDLVFTVTAGDVVDILPVTLLLPRAPAGTPAGASGRSLLSGLAPHLGGGQTATLAILGGGFAAGLAMAGLMGRRRAVAVPLAIAGTVGILAAVLLLGPRLGIAHENGPATDAAAPQAAAPKPRSAPVTERAQRQPDGTLFVPKPVQRVFAVENVRADTGALQRAIELPGRIIPDPDASGHVQTAVGGRLSPPPGGFPRLGTSVKEGDVLAYVTPPMQAIDVSDMRQRQGELDQQIAIVERRLVRYEQLSTTGAVARSQLEDTRLELQGLRERRASLDRIRRDPEALVAPVSGVVAEGVPVAGQIAQTNAVVFQIVDPARLWVEALSFEALDGLREASARTAAGRTLSLVWRGAGFADRGQSVPVHFAVKGDVSGLRSGQFVTVFAATGEPRTGVAVPRTAVTRTADGQDQVYDHVSPERFVPRIVRTEPLDGERVLILAGVEPGHRIVTQGAALLDNVR
ncbi:MAG: efflux RND transporter periplasmic adaptor subunit [Rhodovulum sp.]|nr:efflux RND transporter periplasmic adaptor subunit [Rhodovulum sp.]